MTAKIEHIDGPPTPYIFISYRRDDALSAARRIMQFLHEQYGLAHVFMDIAENRDGDEWKRNIEIALNRATVLVPVIGRDWLTVEAASGGRRIDQPRDWVRKEVAFALKQEICVIPVFIGISPLKPDELPNTLRPLAGLHGRVIRYDNEFEAQLRQLGDSLQKHGFPPLKENVKFPRAMISLKPLTSRETQAALAGLDGWRTVSTQLPGKEHVIRNELYKRFEFARETLNKAASCNAIRTMRILS